MNKEKSVATYKIEKTPNGNRYKFYCDLSGALVCTTKIYKTDTSEEELMMAWLNEGKEQFNVCHNCGKFVSDVMFNVDVLECVECAPFEVDVKYCKNCGTQIDDSTKPCPVCGKPLVYYGKEI